MDPSGSVWKKKVMASQVPQEPPPPPASPKTISIGDTTSQVLENLGQPEKVIDLGAKKIFVYKDLKITFVDGKVSDVQ